MSAKAFKFASPGIQLNEIDKSQIPEQTQPVGPIIIGRAARGPSMRPVTVSSFDDFIAIFGEPVAGGDSTGDVWRSGMPSGPTYGAYAAQAWLANNPTVTYVRLLGVKSENPEATTTNNSGKAGWTVGTPTSTTENGAYGLFVFHSSSDGGPLTGSLSAVWYCTGTVPVLTGAALSDGANVCQNSRFITSDSTGYFTVIMSGSNGGVGVDKLLHKKFNFNPTSGQFIRKVFNTNPQNCNKAPLSGQATGSSNYYGYWLGETFENDIFNNVLTGSSVTGSFSTKSVGIILPLNGFGTARLEYEAENEYAARTGWIIGQVAQGAVANYVAESTAPKLFRLIAIDPGEWIRNNLKVTISNILPPQNEAQKYGTFDVEIRRINDTDANKKIVESFVGCNLDPTSPNYVARRIGDLVYSWDDIERRLNIKSGLYSYKSKYVRVEMYSEDLDSSLVPFGVLGPLKVKDTTTASFGTTSFILSAADAYASSSVVGTASGQTYQFRFPSSRTRVSSSEDSLNSYKLASWGSATTRDSSSILYNDGLNDLLRVPVMGDSEFTNGVAGTSLQYAWTLSLDNVCSTGSLSSTAYYYVSGSKALGTSFTGTGSGSYAQLLTNGVNSFTTTLQGGFDGFNILEGEPLRNSALSSATNDNSYIYYTYRRAIDLVREPEEVQGNILLVPGLTYEPLTDYILQTAEYRKDVLAIIDDSQSTNLATYVTKYEKSDNAQTTDRCASVDNTITAIKGRNLNNNYGCTYYPWTQIADSFTGKILAVPPSIVALGAMSYTDRVQAPWFAPAGFNRGGLSTGNAGVNVVNVVKKLTAADRDKLYSVNINPIASFPNEGIVIFGQKTLQATPSALDRINVRRLMLYVKRGIDLISKSILFEPNIEDTWNNFKDKAEPFLSDVKARFGLEDYKLILDSTTTTPDLIDQNILYGIIKVKPAKAIEYIAFDFEITRSGASFND